MSEEQVSTTVDSTTLPTGDVSNGSEALAGGIFEGLDSDSLQYAEQNGIKTMSDALTKSREAEKLIGGSLRFPGDDATPDDVKAFFDKANKPFLPDTAEGYEFAMPESVPENMEYNSEMVDNFKTGMFERGVPPQIANEVHDWFMNDVMIPAHEAQAEAHQAETEALQKGADESTALMEKTWGKPDSQEFKAGMEHVQSAINELGGDDYKAALIEAGAIDAENNILNAKLLLPLAAISQKFLAEDSLVQGESLTSNPFADDSKDWTKINSLVAEVKDGTKDPQSVKALIKSAGKDPAAYGL